MLKQVVLASVVTTEVEEYGFKTVGLIVFWRVLMSEYESYNAISFRALPLPTRDTRRTEYMAFMSMAGLIIHTSNSGFVF
jgi:hypothetical protein